MQKGTRLFLNTVIEKGMNMLRNAFKARTTSESAKSQWNLYLESGR